MVALALSSAFPGLVSLGITSQNSRAFLSASVTMVIWVEAVKYLSTRGLMNNWIRRKVMHIGTGPIFISMWRLFDNVGSNYAACVPLLMTIKFGLIGLGLLRDNDAIHSMSRTGDRSELLRGPLLYGIVFVLSTVLLWKDLRAVIALFALCFGDGFAEVFGRKFGGNNKLLWSKEKSLAGSLGFVVASATSTLLFVAYILSRDAQLTLTADIFPMVAALIPRVLFANVAAALAESLPLGELDNFIVFASAAAADALFCNVVQGRALTLPQTGTPLPSLSEIDRLVKSSL
jgi:dolichol kinase